MASEVDIGNLGLAHIGDEATVSSFDPPEGSDQAEHVARFYPIARDVMLESHPWNFATKRASPASVASETDAWAYAYELPPNCLHVFAVLPPGAGDSYGVPIYVNDVWCGQYPADYYTAYSPQDFVVESLEDGTIVVYTNCENADIRFVARITDSTKFSALFTLATSRLLASFLAGPVIKGDVGRAESKGQYQIFQIEFGKAVTADTRQRRLNANTKVLTPWIQNR